MRESGREVVEHLVGLGPQLAGVVRGELGQAAAQFVDGAAQRLPQQGQQLIVPDGQSLVAVLFTLAERRVALVAGRDLLRVPFVQLGELGGVLLAQPPQLFLVLLGESLELLLVLLEGLLLLRRERVERAPVGERHDGADELVAVAHGRGRQVDRDPVPALGPQHLPAHPVLAPGAQGVVQRRLAVREGGAVLARVQYEGVQPLPPRSLAR